MSCGAGAACEEGPVATVESGVRGIGGGQDALSRWVDRDVAIEARVCVGLDGAHKTHLFDVLGILGVLLGLDLDVLDISDKLLATLFDAV